ncbi:MAG: PUR family DNA/RNA-binding protein [Flavobacteriales bacterium]|nr:PUR family DNA/RNA-binding protein [Flavobacteriales bacterium]
MSDGANHRDDLFSKAVRAGKRTYFFDVKTTRGNDLYMTIAESKRRFSDDGRYHYEKHKLFLYKEDFEKFAEGLQETIERIEALRNSGNYSEESPMDRSPEHDSEQEPQQQHHAPASGSEEHVKEFTDIEFDDLED